jgi:hypothetical protein
MPATRILLWPASTCGDVQGHAHGPGSLLSFPSLRTEVLIGIRVSAPIRTEVLIGIRVSAPIRAEVLIGIW